MSPSGGPRRTVIVARRACCGCKHYTTRLASDFWGQISGARRRRRRTFAYWPPGRLLISRPDSQLAGWLRVVEGGGGGGGTDLGADEFNGVGRWNHFGRIETRATADAKGAPSWKRRDGLTRLNRPARYNCLAASGRRETSIKARQPVVVGWRAREIKRPQPSNCHCRPD